MELTGAQNVTLETSAATRIDALVEYEDEKGGRVEVRHRQVFTIEEASTVVLVPAPPASDVTRTVTAIELRNPQKAGANALVVTAAGEESFSGTLLICEQAVFYGDGWAHSETTGGDGNSPAGESGGSQPWTVVPVVGPAEVAAAAAELLVVDAAADDVSIHLPASPTAGDQVGVWLSTSPDSSVVIDTTDATTIDGQASVSLSNPFDVLIVVFGGDGDWAILAQAGVRSIATKTGNVLPNALISGDNVQLGAGQLRAGSVIANAVGDADPDSSVLGANPGAGAVGGYWWVDGEGYESFGEGVSAPDPDHLVNGTRKQWYDGTETATAVRFSQRDIAGNLTTGKAAAMNDGGDAFLGVDKPHLPASPTADDISTLLVGLGLAIQD